MGNLFRLISMPKPNPRHADSKGKDKGDKEEKGNRGDKEKTQKHPHPRS